MKPIGAQRRVHSVSCAAPQMSPLPSNNPLPPAASPSPIPLPSRGDQRVFQVLSQTEDGLERWFSCGR